MQNNEPIRFNTDDNVTTINLGATEPKYKIMVGTPVHSEVSIHYTQALLKFQQACLQKNIVVSFTLYKSSLVQQGRNLIVSEFLNDKNQHTHLLFIDSDIDFQANTIFKMLEKDKDIIAVPYPMKYIDWPKLKRRMDTLKLTNIDEIQKAGFHYPIKVEGMNEVVVDNGVAEVTHAPTGCMLIKREVLEKMIKHYPELRIHQPTLINHTEHYKENFYNLFECLHDLETKQYYGEDFGFCKRWTKMGGKIHLYCMDHISHTGEYEFCGRYWDELLASKGAIEAREKGVDAPKKIT
tara:strand:- start:594 stop:1475 length:882 start_codon:yes stop_codon:yes gene_type:complete